MIFRSVCNNKHLSSLASNYFSKTRKIKKKIVRNATVLNNGAVIRIRREKSTDGSDEDVYTASSSDEEASEDQNQHTEQNTPQEEPMKEKTPEPEGSLVKG